MEGKGSRARVTGKPLDGPVSRYINRPISTRISSFIIRHSIPITPNQASLISFLVALTCLPIIMAGHLWLGGILAQLSSILDGVDGELARARGLASRRGGFLDSMLDRYADTAIVGGLALYLLGSGAPSDIAAGAAITALSGVLMVSYLHARGLKDLGLHPIMLSRLGGAAGRDVRLFLVFVGCLASRPLETLAVLGLLTHSYVVYMTVLLYSRSGRG